MGNFSLFVLLPQSCREVSQTQDILVEYRKFFQYMHVVVLTSRSRVRVDIEYLCQVYFRYPEQVLLFLSPLVRSAVDTLAVGSREQLK